MHVTKRRGYQERVSGDKLIVDGIVYLEDELHLLPKDISMESIHTRLIGLGIGFFSPYSFLSNMHPAKVVINGQNFLTSEHAYQYSKAVMCGRDDLAKSIKDSVNPKKAKYYGNKVITSKEWENNKKSIMRCIVLGKFTQNELLREKLLDTGRLPLMECSTNTYWGTGWRLDSPEWKKSSVYHGSNNLGTILSEVRELVGASDYAAEKYKGLREKKQAAKGAAPGDDNVKCVERLRATTAPLAPNVTTGPAVETTDTTSMETEESDNVNIALGAALNTPQILNEDISVVPLPLAQHPSRETKDMTTCSQGTASVAASSAASGSDIAEIEEAEASSLYFDSELQSRTSFSAKSVISDSGHLDHEKMLGWTLPTVNKENLRKLASTSFPGLVGVYNMEGGNRFVHECPTSTPVAHINTNITSRKSKKGKRSCEKADTADEKWNILRMLS